MHLHFKTQKHRQRCLRQILGEQGFESQIDQYDFVESAMHTNLEMANCTVLKAQHRITLLEVAIKVVYKDVNMKSDNLFLPEIYVDN